jgi:hypothetical protein
MLSLWVMLLEYAKPLGRSTWLFSAAREALLVCQIGDGREVALAAAPCCAAALFIASLLLPVQGEEVTGRIILPLI